MLIKQRLKGLLKVKTLIKMSSAIEKPVCGT